MPASRPDGPPWPRVADVLGRALDLAPTDRPTFLDTACRRENGTADADLRREVEALLDAAEAADAEGRLGSPVPDLVPPDDSVGVGDTVGPWRLTGMLGEGGMGAVYAAERADGLYDREVALKRLRSGPGRRRLAARLHAERRTLARLEHPGIARLYDGGVADDGTPYLVMERVDGEPITAWARRTGASVEERVRLFLRVCQAVAYAHARLVVHRDLKPSNVFVTTGDGPPAVMLLDFGIAKLLDAADATETVGAAMTPAYAAPEQLTGGDVTTATDVYSLGVLLYEVLAGQRPYDLSGATAAEAERIVREAVPPPPSSVDGAEAGRLTGDLDVIVGKALAKEPAHRYPTADALADDLGRHLDGLPVAARPATVGYRAGRFVRRHRAGVAAAALVVLALVAGLGAALWQAGHARAEAAKAEAVQDFLLGMLGAADPIAEGRDVRVADLLDGAAASLDTAFAGRPGLRADVHERLGQTYYALGLLDEAAGQYARALALRERLDGPAAVATALAQRDLGTVRRDLADFSAADSLYGRALATLTARVGERHEETASTLAEIGTLRYMTGDSQGSADAHRRVLAIEEALLPPTDPELLLTLGNLAVALYGIDLPESTALLERQVGLYRAHHANDRTGLANALANLGAAYAADDRLDDAAEVQAEAVGLFRSALGDAHPSTAFGLNNLGASLTGLGRPADALPLLEESAAIYRGASGERHPNVGYPLINLAKALRALGRLDPAEATAREARALFLEGFGADHPSVGRADEALAAIEADR